MALWIVTGSFRRWRQDDAPVVQDDDVYFCNK
jgi:hypothetical protein